MSIIQWKLAYTCLLISFEVNGIASIAIPIIEFVSKSLFCTVILINSIELDESILQVDVLKLLKNAGWNSSSQSNSEMSEPVLHSNSAEYQIENLKLHNMMK